MNNTFQEISGYSDFMQGDLIENITQDPKEKKIGMILNADCDIAQDRWGSNFSWINIIPAITYLEEIWSAEQCRLFLTDKRVAATLLNINKFLKKSGPNFQDMDLRSLCEWLKEYDNSADFFLKIGKTPSANEISDLDFIRYSSNIKCLGMTPGDRVRKIWGLTNKDQEEINKKLKNALLKTDGFPDFFFLPKIPNKDNNGFVALLRTIESSPHERLFKNDVDARVNASSSQPVYFRFGRLTDAVRYQVVQKLTFLFSRIGSHPTFEEACKNSASSTSSDYIKKESK